MTPKKLAQVSTRKQGRPAKDGATGVVRATILVLPNQKEKLTRLGQSVWARAAIDAAEEPGKVGET
jgi:hypothetical protein